MKQLIIILITLLASSCTQMKVVKVNEETGYFDASKKATIVKSEKIDLDKHKGLLLIPDGDFVKGQINNIGYFDELITFDELEKYVVQNGLQDKIPSLREKIGVSNAYKHYKPFLWFRFDIREEKYKEYAQYILTNPETLEDIFVAEIYVDIVWTGVNDQYTWYPLFNALIDYISENSATFRK